MRIGIGYDIHRLQEGRPLVLGGILVPHTHGLEGHSDADALTHAICDALLGAMNEGDLGRYYPSNDPKYKNMNSLDMLIGVAKKLAQQGFRLVNLDTIIIAQAPRLGSHLADMAKRLAEVLGVDPYLISVKVKSGDHIGAVGRMEGIAAQAICLIETTSASS
ncbi:2-C-methyl-D-erythritol 2,4-cyclodiphosphate synthase [Candidatus Nitronereus thalassa]|uniref:2-C-methyl-D-erythritol 2,4-cyclodiphosphate synthase n=1 Tax=Candidatus Nitronereus thalassa TaxID=3020898 RepID=A0ABU3K4H7_9BACT|nr:2-C-methyl-D-erythritol 2,4-cyclodiphosphate synthase [Candidatus Nitronereus thalassa]MDT7041258.1 2-C-methyl-D-erythritol 2,4-cyclodiphosphate synthase [Candidatus Nitronereus thalassa]